MMSLHPVVISPSIDTAAITSGRWALGVLREDGFTVEEVAGFVAEHLADTVATYGVGPDFEQAWLDQHADEVDPTPMHQWQVTEGVSGSEQHERVMRAVRDLENGAA